MFKLEINGCFRGSYNTAAEAMADVEKWARPFSNRWVIYDSFGRVYAQG